MTIHQRSLLSAAALAAAMLVPGVPALAAGSATAVLKSTDGTEVARVGFQPAAIGGLIVVLQTTGLPPGIHAFHLHETGACDAADGFKSAGGHFNPTDKSHGWLNENGAHLGDLPNLHVPQDGVLAVEYFLADVTLGGDGDGHSLMDDDGTAVVVHVRADDYKTDPAGDAGERIACGVIEME